MKDTRDLIEERENLKQQILESFLEFGKVTLKKMGSIYQRM
jgi:hypothetical protein